MLFAEYELTSGYVINLSEERPETITEGCSVALLQGFNVGDEFNFLIKITEVDELTNVVTSFSAIRCAKSYTEILNNQKLLKQQVDDLNIAMAAILGGAQ